MDRLEQIKKAIENAKMDSLLFGQLLSDIEWLIEQAERVKNYQKDIELKNNLMAVLKHSNRHYQLAFETLEDDYEQLKRKCVSNCSQD
jgi:hypothetical protein